MQNRRGFYEDNVDYVVARPLGSAEFPVGTTLPREHPRLSPSVWENRKKALFKMHAIEKKAPSTQEKEVRATPTPPQSVRAKEVPKAVNNKLQQIHHNTLRKMARAHGLPDTGTKKDVVERLLLAGVG